MVIQQFRLGIAVANAQITPATMRWLKEQIDRWAIATAARMLPRLTPDPAQADEAAAILRQPALFAPPERCPQVALNAAGEFQFPSSIQTPFANNNTVHGRLFQSARGATAPMVVLIHGWNAEMHYLRVLPRVARALNARGINAILLELPYHLHRRPPRGETMTNFISENIPRMLEATTQAVADINAVLHWARNEGASQTATWGFSLGGWLAGLHASASTAQDATILATPVANLERAVRELEFCHPIRAALAVVPVNLHPLNLATRTPRISPNRILLVEANYDLFVPSDTCAELAAAWHLPASLKVPQSHISILFSRRSMRQIIDWLESGLG